MTSAALAWRSLVRALPKRWPLVVLLSATVGLLVLGNTVLQNSSDGLQRTYSRSFTGDWTLSGQGDEAFTLFGSELPLIGEYYVLPTLPDASALLDRVRRTPGVQGAVGQVTAGGQLAWSGWSAAVPVFGVVFADYFRLFPDLRLTQGSIGPATGGSLLLNQNQYEAIGRNQGRLPALGETFTLTVFNDNSFTIRQVTLRGVFSYAASDAVMDKIVLADPETARALNGYVYGGATDAESSTGTSLGQLDDLFAEASDVVASGETFDRTIVENSLADTSGRERANQTVEGAWNFILARGDAKGIDVAPGIVVRDWRASAGGNALVIWLLQLVFSIGLGIVTLGAALIIVNALSLSVAERSREFGTMRALGASRSRVALVVGLEVALVVVGAGVLGIVVGMVGVAIVGGIGVPLPNPLLRALFGTEVLRPAPSWELSLGHLVFVVLLAGAAIVGPVRRVLGISPRQAMARAI